MSKHLDRIRAQQEAFRRGKRQRDSLMLVTIVVCIGLMFGVKTAVRRNAAAQAATPTSPLPTYSQPQENYWNLRIISAASPITADEAIKLTDIPGGRLDSRAAANLSGMLRAAEKEGVSLTVAASYRTIAEQKALVEARAAEYMAEGKSREESLRTAETELDAPGESDFHTGLTVAFAAPGESDFGSSPAGGWLSKNAAAYGFIERYPAGKEAATGHSAEPGVYRYVGPETAAAMNERGFCLEEYRAGVFTDNTKPEGKSENGN